MESNKLERYRNYVPDTVRDSKKFVDDFERWLDLNAKFKLGLEYLTDAELVEWCKLRRMRKVVVN